MEHIEINIETDANVTDANELCVQIASKQKINRNIVHTRLWNSSHASTFTYNDEQTLKLLHKAAVLYETPNTLDIDDTTILIIREIRRKLNSYYTQDKKAGRKCIKINPCAIIHLLINCQLQCHYCTKHVCFFYNVRRDETQWSLERIDNKLSHVLGNIVISCLRCNLQRRTQSTHKFSESKKYTHIVCCDSNGHDERGDNL